ncbi:MAG: sigma-70 family RNA polymerase sigma factor [Planctomycetes bacterium]|nr:sigma-70 family RNA polymerase sigma factor [Planctomycetota bacterium]
MDPEALLAHRDFVRALARRLVADPDRADDLAQETWLAALEHEPATDRSLKPWLTAVARNLARFVSRSERRRTFHERAVPSGRDEPSAADIVEREMARRKVVDAVLALDEPYRATILFRFFEDLPPKEIARRQGVPVDTVKTRLKRGLDQLRARLDREHGGDRRAWCLALLPLLEPAKSAPILLTGVLLMKLGTKIALVVGAAVLLLLLARWTLWSDRSVGTTAAVARRTSESVVASTPQVPIPSRELTPSGRGGIPALAALYGQITGRVVDHAGNAVPGARVVAYPDDVTESVSLGDAVAARGRARATTTGESGRFAVPLADESVSFTLIAQANGFSPASLEPVTANSDVTLTLDSPRAMVGQVMDVEGRPIAGARVRWTGFLCGSRLDRDGVSGDDGKYRIDGLPSRAAAAKDYMYQVEWWVEARAEGFAPLVVSKSELFRETNDVLERNLVLVHGATLKGHVVDGETSKPIPGAKILVWSIEGSQGNFRPGWVVLGHLFGPRSLGETLADAEGTFAFTPIPSKGFHHSSSHWIGDKGCLLVGNACAVADGYAPSAEEIPVAPDDASLEIEIRCWPAASIRGRVVDASGRPIPGLSVSAESIGRRGASLPDFYSGIACAIAKTDVDGRYVIAGVPAPRDDAAATTISTRLPGCRTESTIEVMVRAGQTTDAPNLVAVADPSATIVVVDEAGHPIAGANLEWREWHVRHQEGRTDKDGKKRFYFSPAGSDALPNFPATRLVVRAQGHATAATPEFVPSIDAPPEVRVVLGTEHRISGRVRLADGSAASDTEVTCATAAVPVEDSVNRDLYSGIVPDTPLPNVYCRVKVNADGSFVVDGLPSGVFNLRAHRERYLRRGGPLDSTHVDLSGVAADSSDVLLSLPVGRSVIPTAVVEGTVVDAQSGKAVPRFSARLFSADEPYASHADVVPGRFRFEEAPIGTWTLGIQAEGYPQYEQRDIVIGPDGVTSPLQIRLARGVRVHGVVRGPADLDLVNAAIDFVDASGQERSSSPLSADGSFEATGFLPGRYVPVVRRQKDQTYVREPRWAPIHSTVVQVDSGSQDIRCNLTVVHAGALYVSAKSPRIPPEPFGEAPTDEQMRVGASSRVEVRGGEGELVDAWSGLVDSIGRILYVAPGNYRVRIEVPGVDPREKRITVDAGEICEAIFDVP